MEIEPIANTGSTVDWLLKVEPLIEHFAPIFQTIIWILFLGAIALSFRKSIKLILANVAIRVRDGSALKAGWFELSEMQLQKPETQKRRLKEDAEDELLAFREENESSESEKPSELAWREVGKTLEKHALAEDLGIRALQDIVGETITRQVSLGGDSGADGAFEIDGMLNLVEVKLARDFLPRSILQKTLDRLNSSARSSNLTQFRIHLVVILENESRKESMDRRLREIRAQNPMMVPHVFILSELQNRFLS